MPVAHRAANLVNGCSTRSVAATLVVACTALVSALFYFEVSISQAAQLGCAKLNALENYAKNSGSAKEDGALAATEFVPSHVIYPPSVFQSSLAEPIPLEDALHHAMLHEACLKFSDSMILWQYARNHNVSTANLINRDDPDLYNKIRQCPDIDVYQPGSLRGHGYCEDSVAYVKYLESRLLPQWVMEDSFEDPATKKKYRYHELCPKTPVIMLNHYWFNDRDDWPKTKKLYVMPNIEMGQLQAKEYWMMDAVLCKTAICARRATKWFKQNGNPRNARVFYTRHTSADVATLAKWREGKSVTKDFSTLAFAHSSGGSPFKGTHQVFGCWLTRPDFPPVTVLMGRDRYEAAHKERWDKVVQESKGRFNLHLDGMDGQQYGKLLAETSFMLCGSTMEGYGHYLNQARAAGALIITTDLAPMNEFLNPQSGVLVPVTRKTHPHMLLGGGSNDEQHGLKEDEGGLIGEYSDDDLCNAVERVMNLTVAERTAMATRSRKQYDIDTHFFAAKMRELRTFAIVEAGRTDDY